MAAAHPSVFIAPHYSVLEMSSMEDVRAILPEGEANELNWLFCGTSGVHGSYSTLDDAERRLREGEVARVTVLVVHPRLVCVRYGDFPVTLVDIAYLRQLVRSTLSAISTSQESNT